MSVSRRAEAQTRTSLENLFQPQSNGSLVPHEAVKKAQAVAKATNDLTAQMVQNAHQTTQSLMNKQHTDAQLNKLMLAASQLVNSHTQLAAMGNGDNSFNVRICVTEEE